MRAIGALRGQIRRGSGAAFELYRFGFEKRYRQLWKFVKFPARVRFQGVYLRNREVKGFVKSVATLGPAHLAQADAGYD
ncbi:hypothetical protein MLD38_004782 [Melastoma candidum]|uniref:Uncharacterized protein n=1 Tax=Melastoma candidum TaxID=119954 RepID=A0ACB9S6U5_9MYRT|nr:hypothetical protein MLD38_004782 [Melastoma candidum]